MLQWISESVAGMRALIANIYAATISSLFYYCFDSTLLQHTNINLPQCVVGVCVCVFLGKDILTHYRNVCTNQPLSLQHCAGICNTGKVTKSCCGMFVIEKFVGSKMCCICLLTLFYYYVRLFFVLVIGVVVVVLCAAFSFAIRMTQHFCQLTIADCWLICIVQCGNNWRPHCSYSNTMSVFVVSFGFAIACEF